MCINKVGWAQCLIRARINHSLNAWVWFPTWARNNCLGPALNPVNGETYTQENGGRLNLPSYFSNMHKMIVKSTKWSKSTGELAHWNCTPKTACLRGPSWVLLVIQLSRENMYFEQGQYYTAESWQTMFWVLTLKVVLIYRTHGPTICISEVRDIQYCKPGGQGLKILWCSFGN
jgi:hypothetical protein